MTRFLSIAAASLALTSCLGSSKDTCSATILEPNVAVTGPKTVAVNQKADFILAYIPQNTCGQLASIYQATGNTANTYIIGPQVAYNDCNCPSNTATVQTVYSFTPTKAGTYYLNFVANTASGYIADTLVAQ